MNLNPDLSRFKTPGSLEESPLPAGATPDPQDPVYRARATAAAVKFESFFIGTMLHQMRASTRALASPDSALKDPVNGDMQDMADNQVADKMASQRAFGIADMILRQLLPPLAPPAAVPSARSSADPDNLAPPLNTSS